MTNIGIDPVFWNKKRVLVTGHTGFKGSWLSLWLQNLGATVRGISLEPLNQPNMFDAACVYEGMQHYITDICDLAAVQNHIKEFCPDIVFHLAAQPLVRKSYASPIETFNTNIMGTINVLEASRSAERLRAIVNVTTDKCYENREWVWSYRENESMGGHDPYSSSKGCVELVSQAYRRSFYHESEISMATARAGNVIGGGDWSLDRLVPDIFRSLEQNAIVKIRNPNAIRPWQHVLEPLAGYMVLAQKLYGEDGKSFAEGWNFGPHDIDAKPVSWIAQRLCSKWSQNSTWKVQGGDHPHEANLLKLDISKSKNRLNWLPKWNLDQALEETLTWQKAWLNGDNMREVTSKQIESYCNLD